MTLEEIKSMSAAEVAKQLQEHQKWRRGIGKYRMVGAPSPYDPYDLGAIIDRAIKLLKEAK